MGRDGTGWNETGREGKRKVTKEKRRKGGGNEGRDCRRGRVNLKVRGRKEKVEKDKGEKTGRWGRERK